MTDEETPLLDTLMDMTGASVERSGLSARDLMLARLAALAAVDAPTGSYALNIPAGAAAGLTLEDARGVLIAVAPIIGTPRTVSAAASMTAALGLDLALADAMLEDEEDEL